jgi:hypothetical protein
MRSQTALHRQQEHHSTPERISSAIELGQDGPDLLISDDLRLSAEGHRIFLKAIQVR